MASLPNAENRIYSTVSRIYLPYCTFLGRPPLYCRLGFLGTHHIYIGVSAKVTSGLFYLFVGYLGA